MAVILAPIVMRYGIGSVAVVTALAGLILVIAGVSGLGKAIAYIPWPVIEGFPLGSATIIFLQQIPAAIGQPTPVALQSQRVNRER